MSSGTLFSDRVELPNPTRNKMSQSADAVVGEASAASPTDSAITATLFIDEVSGSDESGDGTEGSPLKTAIAALERVAGANIAIKVKKAAEGDAPAAWQDISASALKKARKGYEVNAAKKKKADEAAKKQGDDKAKAEEEERRRIEESKLIKLEQDPSLSVAKKVRSKEMTGKREGQHIKSWLARTHFIHYAHVLLCRKTQKSLMGVRERVGRFLMVERPASRWIGGRTFGKWGACWFL